MDFHQPAPGGNLAIRSNTMTENTQTPVTDSPVEAGQVATKPKKLTITLTDRAPVRIVKDDWPIMALAKDCDGTYESQATWTWKLIVRQSVKDSRTLVYGIHTTNWQGASGSRGGVMVEADEDAVLESQGDWVVWPGLIDAIKEVGETLGFDDNLVNECIANLPAQDL